MSVMDGVIWGVARSTILNTMLMSVFERTRKIGIMMSMGMKRGRVIVLFYLRPWLSVCWAESLVA